MIPHAQMQEYVNQINQKFPIHSCSDGYNIRLFKQKNLVIGGSRDWTYCHNVDIIFKKVIFFNLYFRWHDTEMDGDNFFRLANPGEFENYHPDFDTTGYHVFAIDLYFTYDETYYDKNTCFVVAENVFLEIFDQPIGDGMIHYEDPFKTKDFLCRENRVPFLNL